MQLYPPHYHADGQEVLSSELQAAKADAGVQRGKADKAVADLDELRSTLYSVKVRFIAFLSQYQCLC